MVISKIQVSDPGPSWPSCLWDEIVLNLLNQIKIRVFLKQRHEISFSKKRFRPKGKEYYLFFLFISLTDCISV